MGAQTVAEPVAIFRRFVDETVNGRDLSTIERVFDAEVVIELPITSGQVQGRQHVEQAVARMRAAFPDLHVQLNESIGDDEQLWAMGTVEGTNTGPLMGHAPTGQRARWQVMHRLRVRDARIVEWRAVFDRMALLQQLGLTRAAARR